MEELIKYREKNFTVNLMGFWKLFIYYIIVYFSNGLMYVRFRMFPLLVGLSLAFREQGCLWTLDLWISSSMLGSRHTATSGVLGGILLVDAAIGICGWVGLSLKSQNAIRRLAPLPQKRLIPYQLYHSEKDCLFSLTLIPYQAAFFNV